RKIPTRSAHSNINSLFQSAGVICAKRAMVLHYKKLEAEGFPVDFFVDDWRNMEFVQQLIAYHDESQCEVSNTLVQLKGFDSEEKAGRWKAACEKSTGKILSDIAHRGGRY